MQVTDVPGDERIQRLCEVIRRQGRRAKSLLSRSSSGVLAFWRLVRVFFNVRAAEGFDVWDVPRDHQTPSLAVAVA